MAEKKDLQNKKGQELFFYILMNAKKISVIKNGNKWTVRGVMKMGLFEQIVEAEGVGEKLGQAVTLFAENILKKSPDL